MSRPYRLLVMAPFPSRGATTRFRASQYFPFLREVNVEPTLDPFLSDEFFRVYIAVAASWRRAWGVALAAGRRLATLIKTRGYDAIFVQRSAGLIGPPLVEMAAIKGHGLPMIYDLDDALWLDVRERSRHPFASRLLKNVRTTDTLIRQAHQVVAGSEYLASHARELSASVTVLRTVVSREQWRPIDGRLDGRLAKGSDVPVIGWIGTPTTARQLDLVVGPLQELRNRGHRFKVRLVGANRTLPLDGVIQESVPWELEREIEDFRSLDIGLGPMFDDAWSRGKCGFKQLEYMAVGVPVVTSLQGGAREFVRDGLNALCASSPEQWTTHIERLLTDVALRARLATAGRRLVETELCLEVQAPAMQALVLGALDRKPPKAR